MAFFAKQMRAERAVWVPDGAFVHCFEAAAQASSCWGKYSNARGAPGAPGRGGNSVSARRRGHADLPVRREVATMQASGQGLLK